MSAAGRDRLDRLVELRARRGPRAPAVRCAATGGAADLTYGELDRLANRLGRALAARGVERGERVAIWLDKSPLAVAVMQAVLRLGAAYVPIDPLSPTDRAGLLLRDSRVAALVTTAERAAGVRVGELATLPLLACGGGESGDDPGELAALSGDPLPDSGHGGDDPAYILYTSGSTGRPKGVVLSHRNALAFVEWAAGVIAPGPHDRFANHAAFHFDLSVFDLYVAFHAGASVALIPDTLSLAAAQLVGLMARERLTIWYSVPSALVLMMEQGGLLEGRVAALHTVIFAGEPFPMNLLRRLRAGLPAVRLFNFYGPTETNVCTFHQVTEADLELPALPIGRPASGDRVWARKEDGGTAEPGECGELMVAGPSVMLGYWGGAPQGDASYATGDLARPLSAGGFELLGRRDHQVKVRGYRVELGEVEVALESHPAVEEAVVLAVGSGLETRLVAFLLSRAATPPGLVELKEHCAKLLPRYAIVDRVRYLAGFPRTRNGKIDRQSLTFQAAAGVRWRKVAGEPSPNP